MASAAEMGENPMSTVRLPCEHHRPSWLWPLPAGHRHHLALVNGWRLATRGCASRGTLESKLVMKWVRQRCLDAPANTVAMASFSP